jgi:hypothetical protein
MSTTALSCASADIGGVEAIGACARTSLTGRAGRAFLFFTRRGATGTGATGSADFVTRFGAAAVLRRDAAVDSSNAVDGSAALKSAGASIFFAFDFGVAFDFDFDAAFAAFAGVCSIGAGSGSGATGTLIASRRLDASAVISFGARSAPALFFSLVVSRVGSLGAPVSAAAAIVVASPSATTGVAAAEVVASSERGVASAVCSDCVATAALRARGLGVAWTGASAEAD